jgi:uncharacterized protein (DUF488 family)
MEICTTGTSGISAERFFFQLKASNISSIIDTRLHPRSQLAGFAKQDSLKYFSKQILAIPYFHELLLCPEELDLKAFRNKKINWDMYEHNYINLLMKRDLVNSLNLSEWGERPVLLCSEESPEFCHRRLAADFLLTHFNQVIEIKHL